MGKGLVSQGDSSSRKRTYNDRRGFLILVIVIVAILGPVGYIAYVNSSQEPSGSSIPSPRGHGYTWSANLTIQIYAPDGTVTTVPIPSHVGQAGGVWLNHTLDDYGTPGVTAPLFTTRSLNDSSMYDGRVYISPTKPGHVFSISDFFFIWGQYISNSCLRVPNFPELCNGPQGTLYVEVNLSTITNIANHGFLNGENISINFFEK